MTELAKATERGPVTGAAVTAAAPDAAVTVRVVRDRVELAALAAEWECCRGQANRPQMSQRLDLLTEWSSGELCAVVAERSGRVVGIAPLLCSCQPWSWDIRLRRTRHSTVRLRLRTAELVGEGFAAPDEDAIHAALLQGILEACTDADVIRFRHIAEDSPLAGRLHGDLPIWRARWVAMADGDREFRHRAFLGPDLHQYLRAQMSAKSHRYLGRDVRRLERADGGMVVETFTTPADMPRLQSMIAAIEVGTWHAQRGAQMLAAKPASLDRYVAWAELGLMRCYVLSIAGQPVAFVAGYASDRSYCVAKMGFDETWARRSPGKVLLHEVLADLHRVGGFDSIDFGPGDWAFKRAFAAEGYWTVSSMLVRRSPRALVATVPPVAYRGLRRTLVRALARAGLDERARSLIRRNLAR